jgi:aminoglycoside 2''-phosphotransferase
MTPPMHPEDERIAEVRRTTQAREVTPLGEGEFSTAYLADAHWVVRVAKHADASAALEREAALLPVLSASVELAIPRPTIVGRTAAGLCIAAHELVVGEALTAERFAALPAAHAQMFETLRRFLAQLHAFQPAAGVPPYVPLEKYTACASEIAARVFPRLTPRTRQACERLLETPASAPAPVLVHGDLSPEHILFDPDTGRLTGIIDFGDMSLTEADYDLHYLYEDYGPAFVTRLLDDQPPEGAARSLARARLFSTWDTLLWILANLDADDRAAGAIAQLEADLRVR